MASEEKMASISPRAILDSLNEAARYAAQRVNLVVVAKSPLQWIRAFARARAEFDEFETHQTLGACQFHQYIIGESSIQK